MAVMNRIRTVWSGVAGAPWYSNHYFSDDNTLPTAQDAIDAVDKFWTDMSGNISNQVSWNVEGTVARIDEVTGALTGQWAGAANAGVGGVAGDMLPRATQGLVQWHTGTVVSGRMLRGRTFVPALLEATNAVGGQPAASLLPILQAAGQALIADAGNELLVWSRTHGIAHPVIGCTAWTQWAQLRSRRD